MATVEDRVSNLESTLAKLTGGATAVLQDSVETWRLGGSSTIDPAEALRTHKQKARTQIEFSGPAFGKHRNYRFLVGRLPKVLPAYGVAGVSTPADCAAVASALSNVASGSRMRCASSR